MPKITPEQVGERLDVCVAALADVTRSAAQRLIEEGHVTVNCLPSNKKYKVVAGDEVEISVPDPVAVDLAAEDIPLDVVYEDTDVIVINKPSGMVVHPAPGNESGTLVNALMAHCGDSLSGINGEIRPGIVHRIDKDTSDLLVCAKNDEAHVYLSSLLKTHDIRRVYHAIVVGNLREDEGTVDAPIARHRTDRKRMAVYPKGTADAREAVTHYRVLERFHGFTYAEMRLETGRTHQIRVHMSYLSHPLIGDPVYGGNKTPFEKKHAKLLDGQCLHAAELSFPHPRTGEIMTFHAPLPDNFVRILKILRESN